MIDRLIYSLHRILGTMLSVLFLMWFLTGIVMIYHRFPSASHQEKLARYEALPDSLPAIETAVGRAGGEDSLKSLSLYAYLGRTYMETGDRANPKKLLADSLQTPPKIDGDYLRNVAALWCEAPVARIDTLYRLEQWIPFGRLKKDFPIYKFHFSNKDKTQAYLSSATGEVLQCTTHRERVWAWLGAIPHWVYFTWLRQDAALWANVIEWISAAGIFMILAGLYLGIRSYRISAKRGKGLVSPYKKKWYRWHHAYGTLFGIFLLTWLLSGMLSLTDTPDWLGKVHQTYPARSVLNKGLLPLSSYRLDYRTVAERYAGKATRIDWSSFYRYPSYLVQLKEEGSICIDASGSAVRPFRLTENQVCEAVRAIHGEEPFTVTEMTEYDHYYLDRKGRLDLPVWKVQIDNADKTCYYIHPKTGSFRSVDTHSRWHFQLYQGLHSLRYKVFMGHPAVWTLVMWSLLLAGAFVSFTGTLLGINYIIRCCKRLKPTRKHE